MGIGDLEHGFFASSDFDKDKKETEYDEEREYHSLANSKVNSAEMKSLIQFLINKNVAITSTLPAFENADLVLTDSDPKITLAILGKLKLHLKTELAVIKKNI